MTPRGFDPDAPRPLTDREEEVARRVRRALHLPSSMSEQEVAQRFRGSVAWRRARMGVVGEEVREGLADVLRPAWSRMRRYAQDLRRRVRRLWADWGR